MADGPHGWPTHTRDNGRFHLWSDLGLSCMGSLFDSRHPTQPNQPLAFIPYVESLRGLAALMVAIGHSLLVVSVDQIDNIFTVRPFDIHGVQSFVTQMLLILFNGGAAVVMFFAISGCVLGLSLDRCVPDWGRSTLSFLVRRICRIYPAMLVSLLLVWITMHWLIQETDFGAGTFWYNRLYRRPFSSMDLFDNITFVSADMNAVVWTLKVEFFAALALPILHLINRKATWLIDLGMVCALVWLSYEAEYAEWSKWLFVFYLGLSVGSRKPWLASVAMVIPVGCWIIIFLTARPLLGSWFFNVTGPIVIEAVSATMILSCLLYRTDSRWFRLLDLNIMKSLGRCSYSFYLLHLIVLYLIARLVFHVYSGALLGTVGIIWNIGLAVISVVVTAYLSFAIYRWVEYPCIGVGRMLSNHFRSASALKGPCIPRVAFKE